MKHFILSLILGMGAVGVMGIHFAEPVQAQKGKREMSEEGKKLYEDMERIYKKYYETLLAKIKANEKYKADEVWDASVKEAKNATYKDRKEFADAVEKMRKQDKEFGRRAEELINTLTEEHQKAVEEWSKTQRTK